MAEWAEWAEWAEKNKGRLLDEQKKGEYEHMIYSQIQHKDRELPRAPNTVSEENIPFIQNFLFDETTERPCATG